MIKKQKKKIRTQEKKIKQLRKIENIVVKKEIEKMSKNQKQFKNKIKKKQ